MYPWTSKDRQLISACPSKPRTTHQRGKKKNYPASPLVKGMAKLQVFPRWLPLSRGCWLKEQLYFAQTVLSFDHYQGLGS